MAAEQIETAEEQDTAWWPIIGVHAGLLTVAFSVVYTPQPPGWFDLSEYIGFGLIGLVLIVFAAVRRRDGTGLVGSALLALGAATALWMAWDPQLATLPGMAWIGESPLGRLEPHLAHVGVAIAAVFLVLQMAVDRRIMPRPVPFGGALIAAAVFVIALGTLMTLCLRGMYDLTGTSGLALMSFRAVSFTLLMLVAVIVSGVRGVGTWAHLYLGLALLGAIARNLTTVMN